MANGKAPNGNGGSFLKRASVPLAVVITVLVTVASTSWALSGRASLLNASVERHKAEIASINARLQKVEHTFNARLHAMDRTLAEMARDVEWIRKDMEEGKAM